MENCGYGKYLTKKYDELHIYFNRISTDAATNVGVSVGIYIIGDICPPAGIVLGILWFIISSSKRSFIPAKSYEEIHGTITPADATRVVRPHYDYSIPFKYNPHYPEFRQGKLR